MATSQARTRSTTAYELIGHPLPSITGAKLPTTSQVLRRFLYATKAKKSRRDAFKETIAEVEHFWKMARIKTVLHRTHKVKLTKLWETWRTLQKSKSNASSERREAFSKVLNELWDIAAPDWQEAILKDRLLTPADKQEDINFYCDQRGARISTIRGLDKLFAKKKKRKDEREDMELRAEKRTEEEIKEKKGWKPIHR